MQLICSGHRLRSQRQVNCLVSLILVCSIILTGLPGMASAKTEDSPPAPYLDIKAGYPGGAYNEVKTFQRSDLEAMKQVQQDYTFIDNMPCPVIDPAVGVKLTDILANAGIDIDNIQQFTFKSTDGYMTTLTKSYLLDTPRYYFPHIADNWKSINTIPATAEADAVQVPTIMAIQDNWQRAFTGNVDVDGNPVDRGFTNLTDTKRFRLVFGKEMDLTNSPGITAFNSAKWVQEIDVQMLPPASVSLTSPPAGQTYNPGDTVSVAGTVLNLPNVAINVTDPTGASVFTASSLDTSSGSLATSFQLSSAAALGQYTISITGAGLTSACTSTFSVAGPGASVSLTSPPAGQTYWPGQEVTVTGMASGLSAATVIVDDPSGNSIYMANDLDVGSGRFSTAFTLGNDPAGGAYTVWAGVVGTTTACTSTFLVANPGQWISLTSPAVGQTYNPGDTVSVAGTVSNLPNVAINVTDPTGASVFTASSLDTSGGSLATSFTLGSAAVTGRYTVTISASSLVTPYNEKISVGQGVAGGPNAGLPDQIVLSWTDDPKTTQTVSWRTGSDTTQDEVEYLPSAGFSGSFTGAQQATAAENDLYPGSHHFEATLRGLSPGTGYVYRVGRDGAWSQAASFTTAAPSGNFSFLYMGDVQEGYQEWGDLLLVAARENPSPKFALLGGDIVNDSTSDQWQQFFAAATPLFSQIPLMPATGNHDDGPLEWNSFAVPQNGPDGYKEFYSFDYENAHIVVLDSNLMAAPGTGEFNTISTWLRNDLNSSSKTWKFAVLHYPPYQVYPDNHAANLQANWAPIFEQCGVDVVFDAHQQVYARTSPMKNGQVQSDGSGIVYIMGNAGTKYLPNGPCYNYVVKELADVSNYEVVNIDGNALTMTAKDANGRVIDSYQITKQVAPVGTPPVLTAGTTGNTVSQDVYLSFADDQAWRGAITGITVNGTALSSSQYTVAAGAIAIDAGLFSTAGNYAIVVKAGGYQDGNVTQGMVNAVYAVTPTTDAAYQSSTDGGIATMTVNTGVTGWKYFSVQVAPQRPYRGLESVIFVHLRNGVQDGINVTRADFNAVQTAQAGFNVQAGDVVKAYIVDSLTNAADFNPAILQ